MKKNIDKCDQCEDKFDDKSELKWHILFVHDEKRHTDDLVKTKRNVLEKISALWEQDLQQKF